MKTGVKSKYLDEMNWLDWVLYGVIVVNITIPKGGVFIAGLPLTWGYFLIGFASLVLIFRSSGSFFHALFSPVMLMIMAFPVYCAFSITSNGYVSLGMMISLFVATVLMPLFFLVLAQDWLSRIDPAMLNRSFRWSLVIISIYGAIAFVSQNYFGKILAVPYVTTGPEVELLLEKHNMRGDVSKMVSTYNNGNIYGVCALMVCAVADGARPIWYLLITRGALFLTLSRTAWIGLLFYEIGYMILKRRMGLMQALRLIGATILCLSGIFLAMKLIDANSDFIFDSTMGGRIDRVGLNILDFHFLAIEPFSSISEIVYNGVYESFGFLGLILFLIHFLLPWWLVIRGDVDLYDIFSRNLMLGIATYQFCCLSDGAFLYTPVTLIYWLLCGLLLAQGIRKRRHAARAGGPQLRRPNLPRAPLGGTGNTWR